MSDLKKSKIFKQFLENDIKKMSRPRITLPNFKDITSRPDQEVQLIETSRQKELFGRKAAQPDYRDKKNVPRKNYTQKPDGSLELASEDTTTISQKPQRDLRAKQLSNQFNRNTLGVNVPTKEGPKSAALAGKLRSKFEQGDDEYQAKVADHIKNRNSIVQDYNDKYRSWQKQAYELSNKVNEPGGREAYDAHRLTKPAKPKLPRKPSKKAKETKDLSPEQMKLRGKTVGATIEHEGFHHVIDKLSQKHGKQVAHQFKKGLISQFDQNSLSAVASYVHRLGYKPKSPSFSEEVLAHARDLLVNPTKRENFKKFIGTDNFDGHMKNLKSGYQKAYKYAKMLKPEDLGIMPKQNINEDLPIAADKFRKSEKIEKGSLQRRQKFNPNQTPKFDATVIDDWQDGQSQNVRNLIPKLKGTARDRALHRIGASTKSRINQNGVREFLLHRGISDEEKDMYVKDKKVMHPENTKTSWSPNIGIARRFANKRDGHIVSAWIPESDVHHFPRILGSLWDRKNGKPVLGSNDYAGENEVIVHHTSPYEGEVSYTFNPHQMQLTPTGSALDTSQRPSRIENLLHERKRSIQKSENIQKALSPDELSQQKYRFKNYDKNPDYHVIQVFNGRKKVGHVAYQKRDKDGYHKVNVGHIEPEHRGKGLYQNMLRMANDHVKSLGSKGIMSEGYQRSNTATKAWDKVATHANPYTHNAEMKGKFSPEDSDYYMKSEIFKTFLEKSEQPKKPRLGSHFIFSAENPYHKDKNTLNLTHEQTLNFLKQKGYNAEEIKGKYGQEERSIIVYNPPHHSLHALMDLVTNLGQESGILSDGENHQMYFYHGDMRGKYVKGKGTNYHKETPEDYYSTLSDGTHFTHNFDFDQYHDTVDQQNKQLKGDEDEEIR